MKHLKRRKFKIKLNKGNLHNSYTDGIKWDELTNKWDELTNKCLKCEHIQFCIAIPLFPTINRTCINLVNEWKNGERRKSNADKQK